MAQCAAGTNALIDACDKRNPRFLILILSYGALNGSCFK